MHSLVLKAAQRTKPRFVTLNKKTNLRVGFLLSLSKSL
ncbi:hypothetical protein PISS_a1768 [Pseudoalteromonas issachenkonii]|uniref:Uncharacterized protein n=1 Tax=Pseudoalteromonas issachenkonii TaxID=152297 RepID=A0ABN5C0X6_9GAMM|nr:hypothetical protein PISS_a1768 [Pseudoalteromonas issachenkonii]